MQQQQKFRGWRLRFIYAQLKLARSLGLEGSVDKVTSRSMATRKANRPPAWTTLPPPPDIAMVRQTVAGRSGPIEVKKYLPPKLNPAMPRLLFLHGGGWIAGGMDTFDYLCAHLSHEASCLVVSVDYRLAPETPFPGALEDCDDALTWLSEDPSLGPAPSSGIAIVGESAGGNLAAALCVLRARRGNSPICHQTLLYPALDATLASESMAIDLPGLEKRSLQRLLEVYCGAADVTDPLISPMFAENLSALPPALIITADIDPLRDDGARFATKLRDAGVRARYINYPGMPHGFFFMPRICAAAGEGLEEITAELVVLSALNRPGAAGL